MYTWKAEVTLWWLNTNQPCTSSPFWPTSRFCDTHRRQSCDLDTNYVVLDFMTCSPGVMRRTFENGGTLRFCCLPWFTPTELKRPLPLPFTISCKMHYCLWTKKYCVYIYIYTWFIVSYAICLLLSPQGPQPLQLAFGMCTNFWCLHDNEFLRHRWSLRNGNHTTFGCGNLGSWWKLESFGASLRSLEGLEGLEPYEALKPLSVAGSNPTAATDLGLCAIPHMTKSLERNHPQIPQPKKTANPSAGSKTAALLR